MSSLLARTGRERQRYDENNFRLVAGCIPYKFMNDVDDQSVDLKNKLQVLMISSPNRDDLVFPKGGWDKDETAGEAACREAWEEAGVKGILEGRLGIWQFRSKSRQNSCSLEGSCRGWMFALKVTEELDTWPEEDTHRRTWLTVEESSRLCRYDWMRRALEALEEFLRVESESGKFQMGDELAGPPAAPIPEVVKPSSPQRLAPIPDVVVDHPMLSLSCVKPAGTQRLDEHCKCISVGGMMNHLTNPPVL